MTDSFFQDGAILKTCRTCKEDRPINAFVVEEGEELSDVCCFCENHENAPQGLDLESRPYGERLAEGFKLLGDD